MARGYERGFGYLSNVAIDQHVTQRGRERDLSVVVAAHPGLLGIGIDESTALIVQGNTMTVIGRGMVRITDGTDHDGAPFYTLTGFHGAHVFAGIDHLLGDLVAARHHHGALEPANRIGDGSPPARAR